MPYDGRDKEPHIPASGFQPGRTETGRIRKTNIDFQILKSPWSGKRSQDLEKHSWLPGTPLDRSVYRFTAGKYREIIESIKPDLIHALRIPYEGMLAAYTPPDIH